MQTNEQSSLELRILGSEPRLNLRRRRLVQAILENPEESCFLSSRELARRHRVDPSTIVRTVQALGYPRFSGFAADLRDHFLRSMNPYSILQAGASKDLDLRGRVRQSLHEDLERMRRLQSVLSPDQVIALARQIHRSRRIVVVGVDLAASLAWFLAYGLKALGFDAEAPVGSAGNLLHHVRFLTSKDLLIAISFRKCLKATVDAARLAAAVESRPSLSPTAETERWEHCDRISGGVDRELLDRRVLCGADGSVERHRRRVHPSESETLAGGAAEHPAKTTSRARDGFRKSRRGTAARTEAADDDPDRPSAPTAAGGAATGTAQIGARRSAAATSRSRVLCLRSVRSADHDETQQTKILSIDARRQCSEIR